ncbi:MAG: dynamin family protein [Desulfamplus sp.]
MDLNKFIESKEQTNLLIDNVKKWNQDNKEYSAYDSQFYQDISERLNNRDIYIAILGEQGAGKSTLGNVLLSGRNIFPTAVKETTNCLTFIAGIKEDKQEYAEIVFETRNPEKGSLSQEFLRPYVDEQHNPNNEKGVKEIRCYVHIEWLQKTGVWLVDTPGVQSLTQRNHDLTYQFLPKITAAIYLSRVMPPITETEMMFLKSIWETRPLMFFAMNRWAESEDDVRDSKEYTLNVLKEISDSDEAPILYTIDVHRAYEAFVEDDSEEVEEELQFTGAKKLISDISSSLEEKLNRIRITSALNRLDMLLKTNIQTLSNALENMEKDVHLNKEQINEDYRKKQEAYINFTRKMKDSLDIKKEEFISFHDTALNGLDSKISQVKLDMIKYIDDEKMNTDHFQKQFQMVCKQHLEPPFDSKELQRLFENFVRELGGLFDDYIKELNAISNATTKQNIELSGHDGYDFAKDVESETLLKGAGYVLEALGMLRLGGIIFEVGAALWAGGAVLVAAEGLTAVAFGEALAAVWASLSALGPAGWIIAGALTIVGLVGGWFFKSWAKKREKNKLKEGVDNALIEVKKKLQSYLTQSKDNVDAQLNQVYLILEDKMYNGLRDSINAIKELEKSVKERQPMIESIKNQLAIGQEFVNKCKSVQQSL